MWEACGAALLQRRSTLLRKVELLEQVTRPHSLDHWHIDDVDVVASGRALALECGMSF